MYHAICKGIVCTPYTYLVLIYSKLVLKLSHVSVISCLFQLSLQVPIPVFQVSILPVQVTNGAHQVPIPTLQFSNVPLQFLHLTTNCSLSPGGFIQLQLKCMCTVVGCLHTDTLICNSSRTAVQKINILGVSR